MREDSDASRVDEELVSRGTAVRAFDLSRLQQVRSRKKLSLEQVSLLSGVDKSTIGHWETGFTQPSIENLAAVATALDVQIAYLVPIPAGDLRPADHRNRQGRTPQSAAEAVGIKRDRLRIFERAVRLLDAATMAALAELYGIELEELSESWRRERNARRRSLGV